MVHDWDSIAPPEHSVPPANEPSLVRERFWEPGPHVVLQVSQLPHSFHSQSAIVKLTEFKDTDNSDATKKPTIYYII